ncbi:MAG: Response regulator of zinc sigma-54-dependent two-component system [Myxococcales bacterium]|jgi:two-component system response regulator HydG|nr:Response regulator of zinc sigma-54-dependent two-component system [Myxococcales bacterium]
MSRLRALVVDDVVDMAETIANDLELAGYETLVADSGAAAIELFQKDQTDVVVTDLRMKSVDGLDVLEGVRRVDPDVPVLIMTAFGGVDSAVEAMRRGAFHYVTKPFELHTLRALIERACRERALARENAVLRRNLRENLSARQILGSSPPMRQLRALIERVAHAASPVLISGETGSGKELVALAIHTDGPRGERPFVALNCAALPEHLLESELFGHARGAFTGAAQARRGLFVEAEGGTLFLDEVGDLPLPLQGKLLRVLQSGEVRPVGSETIRNVDVRCIAATHKDLGQLVEQGLFREDLFFRLDVLRVAVPSLRERADDIPVLVDHFLRKSVERSPRATLVGFEPDALDFLVNFGWTGNVRQLENLIERLVVTVSVPRARLADVKQAVGPTRDIDPIAALVQRPLTLQALEERYIAGILHKVGGSKQKAAELLGVDPSTLYRREKPRD